MTAQRMRRLQAKIQESRTRLLDTAPYFALLLMYLRFVAVTDIKTISTNGRCVFFSPAYLERLYPRELDYILCHQVMHIVCGDLWRAQDYAGQDYHLACDIRLNLRLESVFPEDRFAHIGILRREIPGCRKNLHDLSAVRLYHLLPFSLHRFDAAARRRWLPDCDTYWDRKAENGNNGVLILDGAQERGLLRWNNDLPEPEEEPEEEKEILIIPEQSGEFDPLSKKETGDSDKAIVTQEDDAAATHGTQETDTEEAECSEQCISGAGTGDSDEEKADDQPPDTAETEGSEEKPPVQQRNSGEQNLRLAWQQRAQSVGRAFGFGKDGANSVPGFLQRVVEETPKAKADWRKILNSFLREQISDYSFSPPDRRFSDTDFFLPDFNEKEFIARDILFMVDTSGSVEDDMLSQVYAEIRGAVEQFSGKLFGLIGFFDVDVKKPVPFESVGDLLRIVPVGGGGTDFRPIFEYVGRYYRAEKPVCIVIFSDGDGPYPDENAAMGIPVLWLINNTVITPPWGKTIRILEDES